MQLWEEDGLSDLCLIPYGCMATGPKTGFIEVVNNARTIAEVCEVQSTQFFSTKLTIVCKLCPLLFSI